MMVQTVSNTSPQLYNRVYYNCSRCNLFLFNIFFVGFAFQRHSGSNAWLLIKKHHHHRQRYNRATISYHHHHHHHDDPEKRKKQHQQPVRLYFKKKEPSSIINDISCDSTFAFRDGGGGGGGIVTSLFSSSSSSSSSTSSASTSTSIGIDTGIGSTTTTNNPPSSSPSPQPPLLTSAILRVSYDGTRFTGWSCANDDKPEQDPLSYRRRRKGRGRGRSATDDNATKIKKGFVRSVQGILRLNLAKLYGNIDPNRIVVEGSSRTDKGVHSRGTIAMIYGLKTTPKQQQQQQQSTKEKGNGISNNTTATIIPEGTGEEEHLGKNTNNSPASSSSKKTTRIKGMIPSNATDSTNFLPVPMNLPKLAFTLNCMLPPDIRIVGIAATPTTRTLNTTADGGGGGGGGVFHPSISALTKTYVYKFAPLASSSRSSQQEAMVVVLEPTTRRYVWNIPVGGGGGGGGGNSCNASSSLSSASKFDLDKVQEACQILMGTHNFSMFQGAPRGASDKKKRQRESGICTIRSITVKEDNMVPPSQVLQQQQHHQQQQNDNNHNNRMPLATLYSVEVTGDRFLYKMVRFLVGAIVDIGFGKTDLTTITKALYEQTMVHENNKNDNERKKFTCAPAHGLMLHSVQYNSTIDWV